MALPFELTRIHGAELHTSAYEATLVHTTGDESMSGAKTFTGRVDVASTAEVRQYNTASVTNFERTYGRWVSNVWTLGTEHGGSGTVARGMRLSPEDKLFLATAGIDALSIDASQVVTLAQPLPAGSGGFGADVHTSSGYPKAAAGVFSFVTSIPNADLATISTAGKVANSATTATSSNTASAIVARDGSGNFSAGTITASLTGTASNASQLLGATWASPAAIGTGTPAAGTFTAMTMTAGVQTWNAVGAAPGSVAAALAGAGAGNVDNGAHTYRVFGVTAAGLTQGLASSAVTVTDKTVNGQVSVTWSAMASTQVTGYAVYRSKAGTTTPFFLVAAVGATTAYADNIADASLDLTTYDTRSVAFETIGAMNYGATRWFHQQAASATSSYVILALNDGLADTDPRSIQSIVNSAAGDFIVWQKGFTGNTPTVRSVSFKNNSTAGFQAMAAPESAVVVSTNTVSVRVNGSGTANTTLTNIPLSGFVTTGADATAGMVLVTQASASIIFATGGTATANERARILIGLMVGTTTDQGASTINLGSGGAYYINNASVLSSTVLGTSVVTSSLTTVGTIGTGVWHGTAIAALYGGTGTTTAAVGDILYYDTTTPTMAKLTAVAVGSVLASAGTSTAPSWSAAPRLSRLGLGTAADSTIPLKTVIADNAGGLFLSGASGSYTMIQIGRTVSEFDLAIAAGAGQFVPDAVAGDVIFRITGNMMWSGDRGTTTHMKLTSTGKVGIGNTAPPVAFHVGSGTNSGGHGTTITVANFGRTGANNQNVAISVIGTAVAVPVDVFLLADNGGVGYMGTFSNHALVLRTNNTDRITVSTAGAIRFHNYGAGTLSTDASGNITASDSRFKTIVRPYPAGLPELILLSASIYRWLPESGFDTTHEYAGFTAQDVGRHIPLSVHDVGQSRLNFDDRALWAAAINAFRTLHVRVATLEHRSRDEKLDDLIDDHRHRIDAIEDENMRLRERVAVLEQHRQH